MHVRLLGSGNGHHGGIPHGFPTSSLVQGPPKGSGEHSGKTTSVNTQDQTCPQPCSAEAQPSPCSTTLNVSLVPIEAGTVSLPPIYSLCQPLTSNFPASPASLTPQEEVSALPCQASVLLTRSSLFLEDPSLPRTFLRSTVSPMAPLRGAGHPLNQVNGQFCFGVTKASQELQARCPCPVASRANSVDASALQPLGLAVWTAPLCGHPDISRGPTGSCVSSKN